MPLLKKKISFNHRALSQDLSVWGSHFPTPSLSRWWTVPWPSARLKWWDKMVLLPRREVYPRWDISLWILLIGLPIRWNWLSLRPWWGHSRFVHSLLRSYAFSLITIFFMLDWHHIYMPIIVKLTFLIFYSYDKFSFDGHFLFFDHKQCLLYCSREVLFKHFTHFSRDRDLSVKVVQFEFF